MSSPMTHPALTPARPARPLHEPPEAALWLALALIAGGVALALLRLAVRW